MYPQPNDFGFRKYIGFDVVGLGRLASLRMGARLTRVGPQLGLLSPMEGQPQWTCLRRESILLGSFEPLRWRTCAKALDERNG
ncbi:hypothetical protein V6N13_072519 [Hibiscus sabdariffa]